MTPWLLTAAPVLLAFTWIVLAAEYLLTGSGSTRLDQTLSREQLLVVASATWLVLGIDHVVPEAIAFLLCRLSMLLGGGMRCRITAIWLERPEPRRPAVVMVGVAITVSCLFGINAIKRHAMMDDFVDWTVLPFWIASSGAVISILVYLVRGYAFAYRRAVLRSEKANLIALMVITAAFTAMYMSLIWAAGLTTVLHHGFSLIVRAIFEDSIMLNAALVTNRVSNKVVREGWQRLHLDRWSRRRRRLLPLWTDLTAACPEFVHRAPASVASHQGRYLLHRTIVEIHDSILELSCYATPNPPSVAEAIATVSPAGRDVAVLDWTVRIARAAAAKARGDARGGDLSAQRSTAKQLLDETDELIELARLWPQAKAIAARYESEPERSVG